MTSVASSSSDTETISIAETACPRGLASLAAKPQERYSFIRSIGFGGMKCVLLVYDRDTDRELALALMPDFRERPHADLEQFVREAKLTAQLEHPNIVPVHDIGLDRNGAPFYTMAYLRGVSLAVVLKRLRGKFRRETDFYTLDRRLRIFLRVCNAINFAHSRNICHLDLKPSNVNIGEYGEVRVLDWGLACDTDDTGRAKMSRRGNPRGTPGYMAPEQISTHPDAPPVGKACDIYSLGALLYAMFALEAPFAGVSDEEALRRTMLEPPPRLAHAAPKGVRIPIELDLICRKAMAKNPAERYASVAGMRHDIVSFQNRLFFAHSMHRRLRWLIPFQIVTIAILLVLFLIWLAVRN